MLDAGGWILGGRVTFFVRTQSHIGLTTKKAMSYRNLKIWKLSRELSVSIHKMSLGLPKFELYETGSQIRRSSKSVCSNIVEGYGRRRYKNEYIRFLTYALASNDETLNHLEMLFETDSLNNEELYEDLRSRCIKLGKMINRFRSSLQDRHKSPR